MTSGPVLLATRSEGKLRELSPLFARAGLPTIDLRQAGVPEDPAEQAIECFSTFEENALAKARYFHDRSALAAVADDSGLEVAALGGAPGARSKRWSARDDLTGQALDDANNAFLRQSLEGVDDRRARYVCVAAYVDAGRAFVARGSVEGVIISPGRGTSGFGYDPYFFAPELGCTFGEASLIEKERVSHRGRAVRALLDALRRG